MKTITLFLMLSVLAGCKKENSDYEKMQKTLHESRQEMQQSIDLSSRLTTKKLPSLKDNAELREICESIMQQVGRGNLRAAFDGVAKYSALPKSEMDRAYAASQKQIDLFGNRFGNFVGYEFVNVQQISSSLVKYSYIAKCENHALPFYFVFYKPKENWTLDLFFWDDRVQDIHL